MNTADFLLRADLLGPPHRSTSFLFAQVTQDEMRPALIAGNGEMVSYGGLKALAGGVLTTLQRMQLPRSSRIAIVAANSPFWVVCYLAILKAGHVAVPLAPTITAEEMRARIAQASINVVCLDQRSFGKLRPVLGQQIAVIKDSQVALGTWPHHDAISPTQDADVDSDADAALMPTSGSTAQPRLVRVSHRNIQANTQSILNYIDIGPQDRMWVVLPLHYCFGTSLLHTYLRAGASLVFCNSFAFPEMALKMLAAHHCTGIAGVPSVFQTLLRNSTFQQQTWPMLRHIQQAGGKLAEPLLQELMQGMATVAPNARIFTMYGQTEATARLSYLPPERLADKLGSIGKGIPGVTLQVLNAQGEPAAMGEVGEIVASGHNITKGYLDDPEATATKFSAGQLRTGDMAYADEDGFLFIVDRAADFIKSFGHRVSSQEVEVCALAIPGVIAAAAIGEPDAMRGEAIRLFVVVTRTNGESMTERDIATHFAQQLPRHKYPRDIIFVDALPMTANGKVAKNMLRGWVSVGQTSQVSKTSDISAI